MTTNVAPLLTVDDLDLLPDDSNRYELIEGEIFMSRAPSLTHQLISGNTFAHLWQYLDENPIGILVTTPGVIFSPYSAVIPDLLFISNERRGEIASTERVLGAPDIVIEIVSPGADNERRDRVVKLQLYGKYGVKEYWIIDPTSRTIDVYVLKEGILKLEAKFTDTAELTSSLLPGFRCKVASIFNI